jgi:exo-beta-1,3-glucanase (GH17 family)
LTVVGFLLAILWAVATAAALVPCFADLDRDADIDGRDLLVICQELSLPVGEDPFLSDLDRDGGVDADDVKRFAQGFGRAGCPEIAFKLHGLNFSPYLDGQDPNLGSFVSEDQIRERMQIIAPFTNWVRSFGTTDGLEKIGPVARDFGLNTAIGAWLGDDPAVNAEQMQNLIAAAQNGEVDLAIVGSEVLLRGDLTPSQLIAHIDQFKNAVPGVPVTTADVYGILLAYPQLVAACDVILVNYYPFWEYLPLDHAMARIHDAHQEVVAAAGGKQVIVSEAGWPSAGEPNCGAVPSPENAADFFLNFVSWARAENVDFFYFEAFDESWKVADEGEVGAHWGIWDKDGAMKDGMDAVFYDITVADNWGCQALPGGAGEPDIGFSYVPAYGSTCNLFGRVLHVSPQDYQVAVYIRVGSGWWTKPTWATPATAIDCRGLWSCDITTGGSDPSANTIAAFLIPVDYDPPLASGGGALPAALYENTVAYVEAVRSP